MKLCLKWVNKLNEAQKVTIQGSDSLMGSWYLLKFLLRLINKSVSGAHTPWQLKVSKHTRPQYPLQLWETRCLKNRPRGKIHCGLSHNFCLIWGINDTYIIRDYSELLYYTFSVYGHFLCLNWFWFPCIFFTLKLLYFSVVFVNSCSVL